MSFDAGSIIAHLDIEDAEANRKLDRIERRVRDLEGHEIKINVRVDEQGTRQARRDFERLDRQVTEDARRRGGLLGMLAGGGAGGGQGFHRSLLSAIGPGIRGIGTRAALIGAGGAVALGGLPALAAPLAAGGVGLAGVGIAGALGAQAAKPAMALVQAQAQAQAAARAAVTPAQQQAAQQQLQAVNQQVAQLSPALRSVFRDIAGFTKWWQGFTKSLAPAIVQPVHVITSMIERLAPLIRQVFGGAMTLVIPFARGLGDIARMVLPLLNQAFRAAAPLMRPLLDGIGRLVAGLLPGLVALLRAARPAITVFAQILGTLGRDIGQMLRTFAPVLRQSAVIFRALMDVVSALFPVVGRLASVFARALAPVFVTFASVIRSLLPFLVTLGRILASFAAAVLKDLVSALGALAVLLRDLAPSFAILAQALGRVFNIMESAGVFGVLGSALERIAPSLARLVNVLMRQLAPILPVLITLVAKFADIMITLLAAGLETILDSLTSLLQKMPFLVPLIAAITTAWLVWDAVMAANPIGAIILAIVALVGAITLLSRHWRSVWGFITDTAQAAWHFLTHGWGQWLVPGLTLIRKTVEFVRDHWQGAWNTIRDVSQAVWHFLTHGWGQFLIPGLTLIRLAVSLLRNHWRDMWNDIRGAALATWNFIHDRIISPLVTTFTQTLPNAFRTGVKAIGNAWDGVRNAVRAPVAWVVDHVIDGLIHAFDWISGKVGGPHIADVHPFGLATGGRIPGYGGGDRHMALLEGGEAVISKETTARHAATLSAWGVPGFQQGGGVGRGIPHPAPPGSGGWLGHAAGAVGHAVSGGLHMLTGGGKVLAALATGNTTALTNAFMGMFGHGTGGAIGDMAGLLTAIPHKLVADAVHFLIGKARSAFGRAYTGSYGAGVAQWRGLVLRALSMEGLPLALAGRVLYQMQTESGGNPNAINLTDSNAAAGDPSRGLLQTIMGTFRAYHWPGTSWNIYNPLANIAAAINYARARYGPQLMTGGMGMGSGHGYDGGGWMLGPPNYTGRPEAVLNPVQSAAFVDLADAAHQLSRSGAGAGGGGLMRDIHLTLPEGSTVAEALREINWHLRVTRQHGFTGVHA